MVSNVELRASAAQLLDLDELERLRRACHMHHGSCLTDCAYTAELRHAAPRLFSELREFRAIARAAKEAAELQQGCSHHFTAFLIAMDRLRAALVEAPDPRAGAAPSSATVAPAAEHELPDNAPRNPQAFKGEKQCGNG